MDRKIWMILQRIDKNLLLAAKQVLNMDEVMLLTGLSKSHLYRLTSSCQIPHYKPFREADLF